MRRISIVEVSGIDYPEAGTLLIDSPGLRPVAQTEGIGEPSAAIGVEGGMGARAADGDIGRAAVHGVGAEALQMRHHPLGGRALRGMDGLHPPGADMMIGQLAHVELLAPPVLVPLDQHRTAGHIERDHGAAMAVEALGGIIVAGELAPVPGAELLLHLDERLSLVAA